MELQKVFCGDAENCALDERAPFQTLPRFKCLTKVTFVIHLIWRNPALLSKKCSGEIVSRNLGFGLGEGGTLIEVQ